MIEDPDARFADFGQAETLKFAEKHAVQAYEKEQTTQVKKRKKAPGAERKKYQKHESKIHTSN